MLRTRLWMGAILILLTIGVLLVDAHLAPWYPFLFLLVLGLSLIGVANCWPCSVRNADRGRGCPMPPWLR